MTSAPGRDGNSPMTLGDIVDWSAKHVLLNPGREVCWKRTAVSQYGSKWIGDEIR